MEEWILIDYQMPGEGRLTGRLLSVPDEPPSGRRREDDVETYHGRNYRSPG